MQLPTPQGWLALTAFCGPLCAALLGERLRQVPTEVAGDGDF